MNTIGLDISQKTIDVALNKIDGTINYLKVVNDKDGFNQIENWLKINRIKKVIIAMEATGIYYESAASELSRKYSIYVINPLKIKEYAKSRLKHTKTDKADAALIADYAKRHHDIMQPYTPPTAENRYLSKLISLLQQLKEQLKEAKNRRHASQDEFVISTHEATILLVNKQIIETAKEIDSLIKQQDTANAHYKNLQTIPGIGKNTASILLRYLQDKPFQTANQFTSFAGLIPRIENSGTSVKKRGRLSRYGHRRLKSSLFMPALVAYRIGAFPKLVSNLQNSKKPKMVIIVAIMRKLAKIAYYIYKSGQPFDKTRHQAA